jgi:hypothetical protein
VRDEECRNTEILAEAKKSAALQTVAEEVRAVRIYADRLVKMGR